MPITMRLSEGEGSAKENGAAEHRGHGKPPEWEGAGSFQLYSPPPLPSRGGIPRYPYRAGVGDTPCRLPHNLNLS